jgi:hypothetical protein
VDSLHIVAGHRVENILQDLVGFGEVGVDQIEEEFLITL